MTPRLIRSEIVLEKVAWVRAMLDELRGLPLASVEEFVADKRTPAAAESYLRRVLEGLLDLCRHVLTKGFGDGVLEYKQLAARLSSHGIISAETAEILTRMAGYRNRMVHFYDEISSAELFTISSEETGDVDRVLAEILSWLGRNPDRLDRAL